MTITLAGACASSPKAQNRPSVLADFPIVFGNPPAVIVVPVTFRGQDYPFIVDTGSTVTLYDASLKPLLGKPVETQVAGAGAGRMRMPMYRAPEARVGEVNLPSGGLVGCVDLSAVRSVVQGITGQEVYGILGMDFLGEHVVQIDFAANRLSLLDYNGKPGAAWGKRFPLEYAERGVPALTATLSDGTRARFLIDTGAAGTGDLEADLFERLRSQGALVVTGSVQCATGSGYRQTPEGQLSRLTLGPYRHDGLRLFRSHWNGLGLGYLSHYVVTFDFPGDAVYLKPKSEQVCHASASPSAPK